MGTVRPIHAPQINALSRTRSTSRADKDPARLNSLMHDLSSQSMAPLPDEAEAVATRAAQWNSSLRPNNPYELWLVEQIALESLRLERCQELERTLSALAAERAALAWDEDRSLAVEVLGTRLKSKPALVCGQLRQTKQGCDWLLGRWTGLGAVLREGRDWDEAQRALALDLLGTPLELRTSTTAVDAPAGVGAVVAFRLDLVREETEKLKRLREEVLEGLDAREQAAAVSGLPAQPDRATTQARRYEAACLRRLQWAIKQLRAGRHAMTPAPLPERERAPASAPAMAPVRPERAGFEAQSIAVPSHGTDPMEATVGAETQDTPQVGCEVRVETQDLFQVEVDADRRDTVSLEGAADGAGEALPVGTEVAALFGPTPIGPALIVSPRGPGLGSVDFSGGVKGNRRARRVAEARRRRACR